MEIKDILKIIDNFIEEEKCSYKFTYSDRIFNITENNLKLLRAVKRKIKRQ